MADAGAQLLQLEQWAAPLLARLQPPARRRLARSIGTDLRRRQARRIAAQENPDGSPYAPRRQGKQRKGNKRGRIKRRAMFSRLRQARHLRLRSTANEAAIGFTGRAARIARVHQYGLRDRVSRNGPQVRYARRELLGFARGDVERIRQLLLDHLIAGG